MTGGSSGRGGADDASVDASAQADAGSDATADANEASAPACAPDARKCDGLNPLRCSSAGAWTPVADGPCPFLCTNGACTGSCLPGARKCGGTDGKSPQRCNDTGDWMNDGNACTSVCAGGVCTGSCPPGSTQCLSPTVLQTCGADGTWQTPAKTCADQACVADSGPAACVGQCAPNATKCSADFQLQTCTTKGQWAASSPCANAKTCIGTACTGVCAPNATPSQCNQSTPQFCNASGQWENRAAGACSGNTPLCLGGQCVACNVGDKRCGNGGAPQICNAQHAWEDTAPCAGDTPVCTNGTCGCTNGQSRCKDGSTPEFCVAGTWVTGNACSGNTPVCIGGSCKECSGTEARCTDNFNILQTCDGNGNWISKSCPHTCSTGGHPHCATPTQVSGIVACGTDLTCASGSEGCCASPGNFHCGACDAAEPQKTPYVLCDGNNDCGPNYCCMVAGPYVTPHFNTYCATDCGVSVQGASKFYTCDPDFPACPTGKTCTAWKDAETVIHVCMPAN
jgi:hypothetical protein